MRIINELLNNLNEVFVFKDFALAILITCIVGIMFIGSALIARLYEVYHKRLPSGFKPLESNPSKEPE